MKMKEAEARTGLDRKNIRYYESEELLEPGRTEGNRYSCLLYTSPSPRD